VCKSIEAGQSGESILELIVDVGIHEPPPPGHSITRPFRGGCGQTFDTQQIVRAMEPGEFDRGAPILVSPFPRTQLSQTEGGHMGGEDVGEVPVEDS